MRFGFITIFILIIFLSSFVFAQEELPRPWILPDSPFYGAARWFERVRMAFTFREEEKARLNLRFAELRIAEVKAMIEKGKYEYAKLLKDYEAQLNESQTRLRAMSEENALSLAEHVANATRKHLIILENILEKVPEPAKKGIENAINVSSNGCVIAVERIRVINAERAMIVASRIADEELNASVEMTEKGDQIRARIRFRLYEKLLNESEEVEKRIEGRNATLLAEHVCNMTYKHIEVLERVLTKVPDEAKDTIEKVINASLERYENCMERILDAVNKSLEEKKWKSCYSDSDCENIIYCPSGLGLEAKCFIPENRTEGICHCQPSWGEVEINCTSDEDCKGLFCPMVVGMDTPICKEVKICPTIYPFNETACRILRRCMCGAKWQSNETQLKVRSEIQAKIQTRVEQVYNVSSMEKIREMIQTRIGR